MAKRIAKTNAARMLDKERIDYEVLQYEVADGKVDGVSVAAKIGYPNEQVYKTLVASGHSKQIYVFIIPVAHELDLKLAAKAAGEKKVELVPVKDILSITGYIKGGCSPLGMRKLYPTFMAEAALKLPEIIVSAGKIGMQLKLKPQDLIRAVKAETAVISA
ncbi:MAG TPA: Cys-tRNA(Pro) deacylase [Planococcus sp. (in: firmicutes)]|nr:Cys-tRNA(Pro) deacylase [Planococcus sp. (in: firmicutes)]